MRVPRLVFPRNLKGPLIYLPRQAWIQARGLPLQYEAALFVLSRQAFALRFPCFRAATVAFLSSIYWFGPNYLQFAFSLGQVQRQGTSHPQHFPSKRLSLLLSRPGVKITPDISCEGSDPGIAAEGQQVPAPMVCSEAGLEDPDEVGMTSLNP